MKLFLADYDFLKKSELKSMSNDAISCQVVFEKYYFNILFLILKNGKQGTVIPVLIEPH